MPNQNKGTPKEFNKTKEGYILAIEAELLKDEKMPLHYYRVPIGLAEKLYNTLCNDGVEDFLKLAKDNFLPIEIFNYTKESHNAILDS